jgi:hypothetical protein
MNTKTVIDRFVVMKFTDMSLVDTMIPENNITEPTIADKKFQKTIETTTEDVMIPEKGVDQTIVVLITNMRKEILLSQHSLVKQNILLLKKVLLLAHLLQESVK